MTDKPLALGGRGTEMFAGIPVRDFQASLEWYQRLFGSPPSFFPNDREAVWSIGDRRWVYIITEPERAGGAVLTLMCDGLEALIEDIRGRGIEFGNEELPAENVRKVIYYDPDGNEIGLGRIPSK
jgi:catechol 2,3-dioxygenase-like lactoylglutathione lyase family enzyme